MSIRFRCDHCGQKLRVGDDKVGLQAKCPKCKASVTVPAQHSGVEEPSSAGAELPLSPDSHGASQHAVPAESTDRESAPQIDVSKEAVRNQTLPEIVIRDDSVDWVYESKSPASRSETVIDYDKVAVPRRVLYLQGGLLAIVALLSFVLGLLTRERSSSRDNSEQVTRPSVLSGRITYGGDLSNPDGGSVVIVLPVDRRPAADARVPVEGLRPGDPVPLDDNISLRTIRGLGGDYGRANDNGMYQIRLPENGRYHVLVISRRAARSTTDRLEATDVAQIGRYFASAVDLLDDRRYQWRTIFLRGNSALDATF